MSNMKGNYFIAKPIETGFTIIVFENKRRLLYVGMNEEKHKYLKDVELILNKNNAWDLVKKYREQGMDARLYSVVRELDGHYENVNPVTENKILEYI